MKKLTNSVVADIGWKVILIKNGLNVQIGDLKTGTQSEILILSDAMRYSFLCSAIFGIIALIFTLTGRIKV